MSYVYLPAQRPSEARVEAGNWPDVQVVVMGVTDHHGVDPRQLLAGSHKVGGEGDGYKKTQRETEGGR